MGKGSSRTGGKRKARASGGANAAAKSGDGQGRRREILGVVLLALGITLALALWSFTPHDRTLLEEGYPATHNLIGPVGHHLAAALLGTIGLGAFVVAAALLAGAIACFARRRIHLTVIEVAGYVVLTIFGAALAHLTLRELRPLHHAPGGAVGAVAGELLRSGLNTTGAVIVASAVAVLALMVASDFTVARLLGTAGRGLVTLLERTGPFLRGHWARHREARAERLALRQAENQARAARAEEKRAKREARRAEKAERRAEKDARRRERLAALREEGTVEADERGLVLVSRDSDGRDEGDEAPPSEAVAPEDAEPKRRGRRGAAQARTPATTPQAGTTPAAHYATTPAGAISPSREADVHYELSPVDPLADPSHADPEWAHGLLGLGAPAAALPTAELPGPGAGPGAGESDGPDPAEAAGPLVVTRPRRGPSKAPASTPDVATPAASSGDAHDAAAAGARDAASSTDAHAAASSTHASAAASSTHAPAAASSASASPADASPTARPDAASDTAAPRADAGPCGEGGARLPTIVAPKASPKPTKRKDPVQETFAYTAHGEKFVLPSLDYLAPVPENTDTELDKEALVETARRLTEKLGDFGISGEVVQIRPGPVITMYEFRPGPGVKISKIQGLSDDLAMAMEALRVRIVAPIPGKNAVGIEVPNAKRQTVVAREILEQDEFAKSKSRLTLALGKNIEGDPVVVDLAKMPHLLIAGTTGSGKSVSVNGMITSMLFKATPDEVRFIMIDPKVLELKLYEGIPHLLLPVVTDPAKAALALRWATEEMDRRYQLLADLGVRDLAGFNKKVTRLREEWEARQKDLPPLPPVEDADGDYEAQEALKRQHEERWLADPPPPERLPMLVIIIDELADLMMVASREVETFIARLAQKARASGIHLMVATQRPSTDVLTGVIKINFPARISFRVASRHDSQTIINEPGAEKLLGNGDMLIIPPGQSEPMRAHGAFLSETEIEKVVEHLKQQGEPVYDETILQPRDEGGGSGDEDDDDGTLDPKWDEALAILGEKDTISVSWLQRRLAIGYNRAARMIEKMEREGIVGPADGSKPREVLLPPPPP
jgi:DNA segregation ATPase FtsK/SpoIIIE, S-DNA-T family